MNDFIVITILILLAFMPLGFLALGLYNAEKTKSNIEINFPIVCFICNLPDESYIVYEDNDFFVRSLNRNFDKYTSHEKFKKMEMEFQPITDDIPLNIKLEFIRLNETLKNIYMVKTDKKFFLTENLIIFYNGYSLKRTTEFDRKNTVENWFKEFLKTIKKNKNISHN